MAILHLDTPIKFLKGIGERRAEAFERLSISTAQDLLWHLPFRYIDASTVTPFARARVGDDIAAVGRVVAKEVLPTRKGLRIFHAVLRDDSGALALPSLEHAAVNNPAGDPFRHVSVRDEKGLRAGGFGILMADQLVDELVYNERRNEVMFVKYL